MIPIRVLLVDDHRPLLESAGELIDSSEGMELVGAYSCFSDLLPVQGIPDFDVALVDYEMPGLNGISVTVELLKQAPKAKVVILTGVDRPEILREALGAGAIGVVTKDIVFRSLPQYIRAAVQGLVPLSPKSTQWMARSYLDQLAAKLDAEVFNKFAELPPLKQRLVKAIARADSYRQISKDLHLSESTVRIYASEVFKVFGVRSRTELARVVTDAGL